MAEQIQHWPCEDKNCEFDKKSCCIDPQLYIIEGTNMICCRHHPKAVYVPPKKKGI